MDMKTSRNARQSFERWIPPKIFLRLFFFVCSFFFCTFYFFFFVFGMLNHVVHLCYVWIFANVKCALLCVEDCTQRWSELKMGKAKRFGLGNYRRSRSTVLFSFRAVLLSSDLLLMLLRLINWIRIERLLPTLVNSELSAFGVPLAR